MRRLAAVLVTAALAACAGPSGMPETEFVSPEVGRAYIPLEGSILMILRDEGAAVALGGGVAVTSAHTAGLVDAGLVIGTSDDYDLMFFRTDRRSALATDAPRLRQHVIAYGQFKSGLRRAEGYVTDLDASVEARCKTCAVQTAFAFDGNAGPGFSGGPVLDADSGKLLGIVFGYVERPDGGRTIYAYPMRRVIAELEKAVRTQP